LLTRPELDRLADLLGRRTALIDRRRPNVPWRDLPAAVVRAERDAIRECSDVEATIVEMLRAEDRPVDVGGVRLHMTADRANFVEVDPQTGRPVYGGNGHGWGLVLYRYPSAALRNVPEIVP
jgi:hypothetical protein